MLLVWTFERAMLWILGAKTVLEGGHLGARVSMCWWQVPARVSLRGSKCSHLAEGCVH